MTFDTQSKKNCSIEGYVESAVGVFAISRDHKNLSIP